jgi:hypothetical protein
MFSDIEDLVRPDDRSATPNGLGYQFIEVIQRGEVVIRDDNSAHGGQVKSACEYRTAFQHCLSGVIEKVIGPGDCMAQRVVAVGAIQHSTTSQRARKPAPISRQRPM